MRFTPSRREYANRLSAPLAYGNILPYVSEFVNMRDYSAPLCGRFFVLQDFCCPDIHPCGFLGAEIHPRRAGCADIQLADRLKIRSVAAVCGHSEGAGSIGIAIAPSHKAIPRLRGCL